MLIDLLNSDNRVEIFESFDDPEQPYSCFEWGEIGQDGIPLIIETEHQFHEWFSISGSFGDIVILDPSMVLRYVGNDDEYILNIIEQMLFESHWIIGDVNIDQTINIQDIVLLVNYILTSTYNSSADLNNDEITNIQDVIIVVNLILNN